MAQYEELFKAQFGYTPECPSCGSIRDWNLFRAFANGETPLKSQTIMSNKTFELINNAIIYSFDYFDKKMNRSIRKRVYGNMMTQSFVDEYLTMGTPEQIAERKKEFRLLPKKFRENQEPVKYPNKLADMKALAQEKGYAEEEFKAITKKADMAAYLAAKALETDETVKG